MPGLIAPAIIFAFGLTGASAFAVTLAFAVISTALTFATRSKPRSDISGGRQDIIRQGVTARRVIYGRAKVSGPLVYASSYDIGGSRNNAYLSFVVVLAAHESDGIDEYYLDDTIVEIGGFRLGTTVRTETRTEVIPGSGDEGPTRRTYRVQITTTNDRIPVADGDVATPAFRSVDGEETRVRIMAYLGEPGQLACPSLVEHDENWTDDHTLSGLTYIHVRYRYDVNVFQGTPKPAAIVRGKKVLDPRTDERSWSANSALCLYDYLVDYVGVRPDDIDIPSVIAAANICDEEVTVTGPGTMTTQPRYETNGTIDLDERPGNVIEDLLSAMAGTLTYIGGQWVMYAGAATPASATITDDDLAGPVSIQPRRSRRNIANAVKAVHFDAEQDYQSVTSPTIENDIYTQQDGGQQITKNLNLPFTTSTVAAQRLAKIDLERTRQQIIVSENWKPGVGLHLRAWDVVRRTSPRFGWDEKLFRVTGWSLQPDMSVSISLREETPEMWAWSAEETLVDPAPDTNLPPRGHVPTPLGFDIEDTMAVIGNVSEINAVVTILPPETSEVDGYELQYRQTSGNTEWIPLGVQQGTSFTIRRLAVGRDYVIRVRTQNAFGESSIWVTGTYTPEPVFVAPMAPTDLRAEVQQSNAVRFWWSYETDISGVPGNRVQNVEMRYNIGSSTDWVGATRLSANIPADPPFVTSSIPPGEITVLLRSIDRFGIISEESAVLTLDVVEINLGNVLQTVEFHPAWAGLILNGSVVAGEIVADNPDGSAPSTDPTPDPAPPGDTSPRMWSSNSADRMFSRDDNPMFTPALPPMDDDDDDDDDDTAPIIYPNIQYNGTFTSQGGLLHLVAVTNGSNTLEYRGGLGQVWTPYTGPFMAAPGLGYEIRVRVPRSTERPVISELTATIDVEDVVERIVDLAVPVVGVRVPLTRTFTRITQVTPTLQDEGTGITSKVVDRDISGPLVRVFDGDNNPVVGRIDVIVQGY